ncbi:MAG: PAS domain-containing protein [Campylobacterales bacterium]|nr:PAS domain-containing protein [Campylobacterales bacterium]
MSKNRPIPTSNEKKLNQNDFIVSKTDTKGVITYGNQIFINMSGYSEHELLGSPHNILRHPDMPKAVFKLLWDEIKNKKEVFAYVKNLCKDGSFYWVFANVTPSFDLSGNIIGYYSVRRKPNEKAIPKVAELYNKLLETEKTAGVDSSMSLLNKYVSDNSMKYNEFIIHLQKNS